MFFSKSVSIGNSYSSNF